MKTFILKYSEPPLPQFFICRLSSLSCATYLQWVLNAQLAHRSFSQRSLLESISQKLSRLVSKNGSVQRSYRFSFRMVVCLTSHMRSQISRIRISRFRKKVRGSHQHGRSDYCSWHRDLCCDMLWCSCWENRAASGSYLVWLRRLALTGWTQHIFPLARNPIKFWQSKLKVPRASRPI